MKGLQITRPRTYEIVEMPEPEPYADEVVVEVKVCNSCTHWDLSVWDGYDLFARSGLPEYPYYVGGPGHELAGVIVQKGSQVTTVEIGDRVALWGWPPETRPLRKRPFGGYVAYFATHEHTVLPFPNGPQGLSWPEMGMLEMLSCVCQGVVKAGDLTSQRVAVSGMGPAGLLMLQALKSRGPSSLTAIDPQPDRCDLAISLGADRAITPGSNEWAKLSEDEFTLSIDCSGVAAAIEAGIEHTSGRLIIFSVPQADFRVPRSARRRATGIEYAETPAGRPGKYALELLLSGQVNVKPLLTHQMPIEAFGKGMDLLRAREALKVSFTFGSA